MRLYPKLILPIFLITLLMACSEDDAPDPTLTVADFTLTIEENPTADQVLGTISVTTNQSNPTFAISTQSPEGAMAIDTQSGELTVADASLFDFEANPEVIGTVTVTAGSLTESASVLITLTDAEENFTIWSGEKITFTKDDGADPNLEENQDRLTENVWITRGNEGGQIYNVNQENAASKDSSPADTEWALGTTADIANLTFELFRTAVVNPQSVAGKDLVLHLITDDVYLDVKFTSWSQGKLGGFSYERSTE